MPQSGRHISIWVTGRCNLNCEYCHYDKSLKRDMSEEVLEASVKWIGENNVSSISFYGGEPLAYPYGVKYFLAKVRDPSVSFGVTTNGTLLNRDIFDWIMLHNVNVNLSFDGVKEFQDRYRDGSYDRIVENIGLWMRLPVNCLMTVVSPSQMHENVKHVRELGFRNCFLNMLDAYGYGYEEDDLSVIEGEYIRTVKELHSPPLFSVNDYLRFQKLLEEYKQRDSRGCGINRQGYCIGPRGLIYPCHRAVECGPELAIGSVWHGVDPVRERGIREWVGTVPEKCLNCPYDLKCLPCPVNCYNMHGDFGVDPEDWYCDAMAAKMRAVQVLSHAEALVKPLVAGGES